MATRQSVTSGLASTFNCPNLSALLRNSSMLVLPSGAHTVAEAEFRSSMLLNPDPVLTSTRWPASKYVEENAIRSHRSPLMVIVWATMSTPPLSGPASRFGSRSAYVMTLYVMLDSPSGPKIAFATSFSMSMSRPSISFLSGLRAPNSNVSAETPTINLPRWRIVAIVDPAGRSPGAGNGPSGSYERVGSSAFCSAVQCGTVGVTATVDAGAWPSAASGNRTDPEQPPATTAHN